MEKFKIFKKHLCSAGTFLLKYRKTANVIVVLAFILYLLPSLTEKMSGVFNSFFNNGVGYFLALCIGTMLIVWVDCIRDNYKDVLPTAGNYFLVVVLCFLAEINFWIGTAMGASSICFLCWLNREKAQNLFAYCKAATCFCVLIFVGILVLKNLIHDGQLSRQITDEPKIVLIERNDHAAYTKEYGITLGIIWQNDPQPGDLIQLKFNEDSTKVWGRRAR